MDQQETNRIKKEVDEIVANYLRELMKLDLEHRNIIKHFRRLLTQKKIKQLKDSLGS